MLIGRADGSVLLVDRHVFFQAMTGRLGYGRTLHGRRRVCDVIVAAASPMPAWMSVEDAAIELLAAGRTLLGDDVLVEFDDGWGTVAAARLYQQLAVLHAQREERFRSMVESAEDVIVLLDAEGRVTYQSRHVEGLPRTGLGDHAFSNVMKDDAAELAVSFQRLLMNPGLPDRGEFRVAGDGGEVRVFEYLARNLLADSAVRAIVVNYRDVTARRAMEDELRHSALHDALTGLPNREHVFHRAGDALDRLHRVPGSVTLLYCDLDGFKAVNDALGHALGDEVLRQAAQRLAGALRRGDTLGRFGGDEFVVVVEGLAGEEVRHLAERVRHSLMHPLEVGGRRIHVGVSIGLASTNEPLDVTTLLRRADAAMYVAKNAGRDQVAEFDDETQKAALRAEQLVSDLRLALACDELHVVYQPIFHLTGRAVVGAEALLRWTHPVYGAVSPADFIGIAESSGLIGRVGSWVLDEACRAMAEWTTRDVAPGWVSVNVSPYQLDDPAIVASVASALRTHNLHPHQLHIELTESAVAQGVARRLKNLHAIRDLGVTVALDDFGTGYSSLSSLGNLPIDRIKIDRSFVTDLGRTPESSLMLQGIVELAHSLGFDVVAEGVERTTELEQLRDIGCDEVQGYLLARPAPAAEVAGYFQRGRIEPILD